MQNIFKIIFIILFTLIIGCEGSIEDMFTFKSVKSAKGDEIQDIKDEAKEYEKQLNKKIETSYKLGIVYQKLGEKFLEQKAWDSAIGALKKANGYGNGSSIVYYSLGVAYANKAEDTPQKKYIEKGEFFYKKALKVEPDFYDARYGLGILIFYLKKEKENGIVVMEDLVKRSNGNYYPARYTLARFYYEMGYPEKSLLVYQNLHADLEKLTGTKEIDEYKMNCKQNIERLIRELAKKK